MKKREARFFCLLLLLGAYKDGLQVMKLANTKGGGKRERESKGLKCGVQMIP